jgi:hypothetical protein
MSEKEILISQYIDNELNLSEKIEFIKEVHGSEAYFSDALGMLETEQMFGTEDIHVPELPVFKEKKPVNITAYASFAALAASLVLMLKVFMFAPSVDTAKLQHRFVIYNPDAANVELTGSFNGWKPINMTSAGGGYWQVTLPLENGEYSYTYIVDGKIQLPDPTVRARQNDGFGGENSVITVGEKI